jgi:very-short-patch-repair endonuclease
LEQAGLNPIVVLLDGHALVGLWLIEQSFSSLTITDPAELRNRLGLKDCILFETTLATNTTAVSFEKALAEGERKVSEDHEAGFVYAIDIRQARARKILPLELGGESFTGKVEKSELEEVPLPVAPALPSVDHVYESDEETPQTRVDQWRRKLLDLTKRNPLLNIKKRAAGFRILCSDIARLEDRLSAEETFAFDSIESLKTPGRSDSRFTAETGDSLKSEFVKSQLENRKLVADCSTNDLEKQLINLFRKSKTDLEEGGSNTLFLALGTLRWREDSNSEVVYRAPLILLPVTLKRSSAKARPRLTGQNGEDAVFNLTLIQMLKQDFEIDLSVFQNDLPKDDSGIDCKHIWSTVRSRITNTPGFEVVEELFLGTFSFAKYLMWKDLSDRLDQLRESDLVDHLVERPNQNYPTTADFINADDVDDRIEPSEFFAPLNADSSQMIAIEASSRGVDFVLEGPPGTGKSETIANMIAHNIAIGKKVLFVSEKMVALDVVYSRLKKVGLGHLCLELHSNKAAPRNVKEQLNEAWQKREEASQSEWRDKAIELGKLRRSLNDYVRSLHRESTLGYTPFEIISKSLEDREICRIDLQWPQDQGLDGDDVPVKTKAARDSLFELSKDIGLAYEDVKDAEPDTLKLVRQSSWSNQWNLSLIDKAKELSLRIEDLYKKQSVFLEILSFEGSLDSKVDEVSSYTALASLVIDSIEETPSFVWGENGRELLEKIGHLVTLKTKLEEKWDNEWRTQDTRELSELDTGLWRSRVRSEASPENFQDNADLAEELRDIGFPLATSKLDKKKVDRLAKQSNTTLENSKIAVLPLQRWISERDELNQKNWLVKGLGKRKLKKLVCSNGLNQLEDLEGFQKLAEAIFESQHSSILVLLERLGTVVELSREIEAIISLFDHPSLQDRNQSPESLTSIKKSGLSRLDAIDSFAQSSETPARFAENIREALCQPSKSKIVEAAQNFISSYERFEEVKTDFSRAANSPDQGTTRLSELDNNLKRLMESSHMLNAWCRWMEFCEKARSRGLTGLTRALESGVVEPSQARVETERALCKWAAPIVLDSCEVLKRFNATKHNSVIESFRNLDKEVAQTTGAYIAARLASGLPEREGPNAPHEYGVLSRELQRKRNQLSVRNLIEELGGFLLELMPCFMMSPLSVAQYLPASYRSFDLVVFDEASQITVWDAVGAIARGKNAIVVGDPKQMPPSNNFGRQMDLASDQEEDLESILDQALAVRAGHHRLTGHYRSKHESLITFSNYKYYAGSLTTYPAPSDRESMVSLQKVDGIYTKGAGTNPIEAKRVVDEVLRRLNDPVLSEQSIGVVTFNADQMQLINNLLDEARRADFRLERFFGESATEPVFVKNLETVQGDQRDVIILSVTYGPTTPGAVTMALNFGPMNRTGGERRLNVAATRAAREMIIFSSFAPSMIDLSRTSAQGMKDLKDLLNFAEKGPSALARSVEHNAGVDDFDSPFEQSVANELRKRGWKIQTQIGASKFKIDLGIYNPNEPGSFLAGVECDGATYHSSPTARDRDRVRHIILENMGWKLIRIWSTDYFLNPENVIERVHDELTTLLNNDTQQREEAKAAEEATKEEEAQRKATEETFKHSRDQSVQLGTLAAQSEEYMNSETTEYTDESSPLNETYEPNEPKDQMSDQEAGSLLLPYIPYSGEPSTDPREARAATIGRTLEEIVTQEAPVTVGRAFRVYLAHCGIKKMGRNVRGDLEKGLTYALSSKQIEQTKEALTDDLLQMVLRIPGTGKDSLRKRGDRNLDEIPPSEIRLAGEYATLDDLFVEGSDEHCKRILEIFDTKRLTVNTKALIEEALLNAKS